MSTRAGFTLVEILVAITIVSILSAVISVNAIDAGKKSRDAERQGDLRLLQSAIELYKQKYGRYPAGCASNSVWSGQKGTDYECTNGTNEYIVGHIDVNDWDGDGDTAERFTFAPEFIPALPKDPKLNGNDSGYVYMTNTEGTVYKLMARKTVESEVVTIDNMFKSCDITDSSAGICDDIATNNGGTTPNHCYIGNIIFQTSYGLWGGWAVEIYGYVHGPGLLQNAQEKTEDIVCMIP
jgi:prepilin-type N-terminal cleavage/methylation domain-containing protein